MGRAEELELKAQRSAAESLRRQIERLKKEPSEPSAPSSLRDFIDQKMAERRSKRNQAPARQRARSVRD